MSGDVGRSELGREISAFRMTLTIPVFNEAAFLLFLVRGEGKAERAEGELEEKEPFPCQLIRPSHGRLVWLVDGWPPICYRSFRISRRGGK